jgi:hypothetical protein
LFRTRAFVADLHAQGDEEDHGIDALERTRLPRRDLGEKRLNLAHRQAARIERNDLVVEAGEAALVFANELRLERALAIARHLDWHRAVVGQHGSATGPIAMIGHQLGLGGAWRVTQMVAQLGAEGALDQRLLKSTRRGFDVGCRERAVADNLVEDFSGDRRQDLGARFPRFRFAGHTDSSCYAPHTKFRTPSEQRANPNREPEPRTANPEPNLENEHEPRSENREG